MIGQDTIRALSVLSSDRDEGRSDEDLLQKLERYASFFTGIALELSPGRRLLFTFALLCPLLGIFDINVDIGTRGLFIDSSPFWFLTSLAAMVMLVGLELVDKLRVRDELEVARQLQRDLLPQETPLWPGWRMAHSYRTAQEIGGDYYDFLPLEDGRWVVTVGDASGHGISAGLLMAIANASLKTAIELDPSPSAVLELLNRVLKRTGGRRAFMTLFYGLLDPKTGELEFASAGHPFPLVRRADGRVEELGRGAFPLGLRRTVSYPSQKLKLDPGDFLVLYSDGLPEAIGDESEQSFGFERLKKHLETPGSARVLHDNILRSVDAHLGNTPPHDDLTLVVMDRAPSRPGVDGPRQDGPLTIPKASAERPPPPPATPPLPTESQRVRRIPSFPLKED